MACNFQLERYLLDAIAVVANENYNKTRSEHSGNLAAALTIRPHSKDPKRYLLRLEVTMQPTEGKEDAFGPYNVVVRGHAFYVFQDAPKRDDAEQALSLNGAAILYGLLRGQVAQITAQGPHGQMLMPTVNFVELRKTAKSSAESGSSAVGGEVPEKEGPNRPRAGRRK